MLTSFAACLVVPLLLIAWSGRSRLRHAAWPALIVIAGYGYLLAHIAASNVRAPREWDFSCFWLYGHVAAAHQNIYDPAVFARFASPFAPSDEFRAAVLAVGFPYPPPTIALFWPLTLIHGVWAELAVWYLASFAALVGAAWILARTFMPADGWKAACLVAALIVALPATAMTVNDAQTNFFLLLLVALALAGRGTAAGAVWQTLAVWVKPYAAVLFILDVICRQGRRLIVAAVTALVSLLLAALAVGPAAIASYVHANPAGREPSFAFVESVNQSLLAIVLRLRPTLPPHVSALHEPLYLIGASILAALTIGLCARTVRDSMPAFCALLLLGLLLYPGSLSSYGVVLIIPLLVVWRKRAAFPGGAATVGSLIGLAVLLQNSHLQRGFEANVLLWIACTYLVFVERREPSAVPPVPTWDRGSHPLEVAR